MRLGIIYVPEDRKLFKRLSVEENLMLGAYIVEEREHKPAYLQFV